jgi:glycerophosphoryl diester phosphodiesterase
LHSPDQNIFENTISAAEAAIESRYPIELDLQLSADGVPMVFHDELLDRMTGHKGNIRNLTADELSGICIHDTDDCIPSLSRFLELVSGQVGLVIELKGIEGKDDGFAEAVVNLMTEYVGSFVLMSFDHHLLEEIRTLAPELTLGLTAYGKEDKYERNRRIVELLDLDFVSYYVDHLDTGFVREFRQTGRPVICWTVDTPEQMEFSVNFADQITFEGFRP